MSIKEEITEIISDIARSRWGDIPTGRVVPKPEDIGLSTNQGVYLDATMLYADLEDSTELAMKNKVIAAEVYKAFLASCSKLILNNNGEVRSFDGDRIMGVFIEGAKNTNAVKTGLQIKYVFDEILVPQFEKIYNDIKNGEIKLSHSTGIDTSQVLVARSGVKNNNDLVWVGRAPNIAAKLSTLRERPYHTFITKSVYDSMLDKTKLTNGQNMWESRTWSKLPDGVQNIYRSSWHWSIH